MKTVQRSPIFTGHSEERARDPNSPLMETSSFSACSSRKEPVPAAQTLFISKSTTTPLSTLIYFESCPPISKIVSTLGSMWMAAVPGRDLVSHQVRADKIGRQVSPRARCSDALDLDSITDLLADSPGGLSEPPQSAGQQSSDSAWPDPFIPVDQDEVGADGAYIDSEVGSSFSPGGREDARVLYPRNDGGERERGFRDVVSSLCSSR